MKIVDVKTYIVENPPPHWGGPVWIFLKLITDEGIEGAGECTYHNRLNHVAVELIRDLGERYVVGSDPFQIERLWWEIYNGVGSRHSGPISTPVLSAIEMACWDIVGKALGQPIYNLLGGVFNEKAEGLLLPVRLAFRGPSRKGRRPRPRVRRQRLHRGQVRPRGCEDIRPVGDAEVCGGGRQDGPRGGGG